MIGEIEHVVLCRSKDRYCGHPRQGGIRYFGEGELVVLHNHAPCSYQARNEAWHDVAGYHGRAVVLLQRSTDGGATWPEENNVVVFDETAPIEERRTRLFPSLAQRDEIDMSRPESMFFFGRSYCGYEMEIGAPSGVAFCLRSPDKGETWERYATLIEPPVGRHWAIKHNSPTIRMPDGSFLTGAVITDPRAVAVYGSDDDGLGWEFLAEVARDTSGRGGLSYPNLVMLPDGEIQCYWLNVDSTSNAMCMAYSHDGGFSWSEGKPIVQWGRSPWGRSKGTPPDGYLPMKYYRSPWALLLRDGRIVVLFGRRRVPFGIGCVVSEDNGRTWEPECVIRADCSSPDLGYPVAVELDDGRVFTAYYMTQEDGNKFGGTRFIAGSFFRLK